MEVFKTIYTPMLTFGCESWVSIDSHNCKFQAVEIKYMKREVGVSKKDKIGNVTIRSELETHVQLTLN